MHRASRLAHLRSHLVGVHKGDESIVGCIAQHTPGISPGEALFGVEHCALGPWQVLLKVSLGIDTVPARQPSKSIQHSGCLSDTPSTALCQDSDLMRTAYN